MNDVDTPIDAPAAVLSNKGSVRRNIGRVAVAVIVIGIVGLWAYAFLATQPVPGRLDDRAFPTAAEPMCKAAVGQLATLPKAHETNTPESRAEVVDQATTTLERLVADLRANLPDAEPLRTMVDEWLKDWATYLRNRRDYTESLRKDSQTRFAVDKSGRDNTQITRALDRFANINAMPSCATPDDVA